MSKEDEDIGFQGFESTAADLDEAITFLKETLASPSPISCRHTIDGTSYTPVQARNVLGVSAMMAAQSIPPSSVQHRSPYTDAWFATATTIPQLPFPNASRFAGSSRMPIADSLKAPFASAKMGNVIDQQNSTGAPSHWPPLSELQRFFGIKPCSQEITAANLQSRRS